MYLYKHKHIYTLNKVECHTATHWEQSWVIIFYICSKQTALVHLLRLAVLYLVCCHIPQCITVTVWIFNLKSRNTNIIYCKPAPPSEGYSAPSCHFIHKYKKQYTSTEPSKWLVYFSMLQSGYSFDNINWNHLK